MRCGWPHCLHRKTQTCSTDPAAYSPAGCEGRRHVQATLARMDRLTVRRSDESTRGELLILSLPHPCGPDPPLLLFAQNPKPAVGHEACRVAAARAKPGDRGAEQSQPRHIICRCVRPATHPPSALSSPHGESPFLTPVITCGAQGQLLSRARLSVRRHVTCTCGASASPAHGHAPLLTARQHAAPLLQHTYASGIGSVNSVTRGMRR